MKDYNLLHFAFSISYGLHIPCVGALAFWLAGVELQKRIKVSCRFCHQIDLEIEPMTPRQVTYNNCLVLSYDTFHCYVKLPR